MAMDIYFVLDSWTKEIIGQTHLKFVSENRYSYSYFLPRFWFSDQILKPFSDIQCKIINEYR